ncbi:uncharacterized protein SPAPADRAFT_147673 [Spathaspora passalidarum NRRL Y-27907]|uniref:AHC1-like C2H2 zinc-finger domain-containing protein n=1 Tax=Spathaspora passalidarum (strain NRRL Y-27907 / 11-Y1) TaxID=619300 RepID=G3AIK2_SPAPN|nr:uncharacterized protein SPAPADRAFT_147673 [Spathaspora passalidarum NRRL Y-27907]EGW33717.1 hypothetical protein SPAPADRAFT_147673 [Spathaspora passalidarum NRRL Y-27907]
MEASETNKSPRQTTAPSANTNIPINTDSVDPLDNSSDKEMTPASQQEIIIKRLREIPHEKLKEIITNQIDLEIRLKHKELNLNDHEISKMESQMLMLRKFFDVPNDVKINNEPNDFTMRYFELLNKSLNATYDNMKRFPEGIPMDVPLQHDYIDDSVQTEPVSVGSNILCPQPGHAYRTRSTTSSLRPSSYTAASSMTTPTTSGGMGINSAMAKPQNLGCLYRRTDGIIVRLTCPDCQRSNFSSAQGFLNHSRIAHAKEYTSQDAAALKCGEILPQIKQDAEGEASLLKLAEKGVDPNRNLNVNEIYFHGLSNTLNAVHQTKAKTERTTPPAPPGTTGTTSAAAAASTSTSTSTSTTTTTTTTTAATTSATNPHGASLNADSELFKKLMKEGNMKKEEYEELIRETKQPLNNPHLFDDEFEIDSSSEASSISAQPSTTSLVGLNKRRQSRGGIKIAQCEHELKDDEEVEEGEDVKRRKR